MKARILLAIAASAYIGWFLGITLTTLLQLH